MPDERELMPLTIREKGAADQLVARQSHLVTERREGRTEGAQERTER
jgi:hypothetical protein